MFVGPLTDASTYNNFSWSFSWLLSPPSDSGLMITFSSLPPIEKIHSAHSWARKRICSKSGGFAGSVVALSFWGVVGGLLLLLLKLRLLDDLAIIFLWGPTQELERHDEEDDADARAGKHAVRVIMPWWGDEAFAQLAKEASNVVGTIWRTRIDGVPIPKHLQYEVSCCCDGRVTSQDSRRFCNHHPCSLSC